MGETAVRQSGRPNRPARCFIRNCGGGGGDDGGSYDDGRAGAAVLMVVFSKALRRGIVTGANCSHRRNDPSRWSIEGTFAEGILVTSTAVVGPSRRHLAGVSSSSSFVSLRCPIQCL